MDCNEILCRTKEGRTAIQSMPLDATKKHRPKAAKEVERGANLSAVSLALLIVLCPASAPRAQAQPMQEQPDRSQQRRTTSNRLAYYLPSRIADFLDIWRLNVGFGLGIGINIRPTKGLQAGLGAYDSVRIGLRGRRAPFWHEWSLEGGFDGMYYELGETERGFHELGGTIHFLLIGLDAAVDIEELLDFGYGLFTSDPLDDDFR